MRGGQPSVSDKSASRAIATFVRGQKQRKIRDFLRPPCDLSETSGRRLFASGHTRYDKTVLSFESFLELAAARLWLKSFVNAT